MSGVTQELWDETKPAIEELINRMIKEGYEIHPSAILFAMTQAAGEMARAYAAVTAQTGLPDDMADVGLKHIIKNIETKFASGRAAGEEYIKRTLN